MNKPILDLRVPDFATRAYDLAKSCHTWEHKGRDPSRSLDWLGFLRAVYQPDTPDLADYDQGWAQVGPEIYLDHLKSWPGMHIRNGKAYPGDLVLFRMASTSRINHGAVLLSDDRIAHAYWCHAPVVSRFSSWWRGHSAEVLQCQ